MDIIDAINTRRSIRAFKPDPVPQSILRELMELVLHSPSWANTQPCEYAVVTGPKLEDIRQGVIEKAALNDAPAAPDIARPQVYPEPYDSRRRALGARLYEVKGITRDDKEGRTRWAMLGMRHFEAPCVIFIYIDRAFFYQSDRINVWPVFDCGVAAANLMLIATKFGLGTVVQAQATLHSDVVKKVLEIPDFKLMVIGIAIGYPDWDDPANRFRSLRESLDKVTRWYGFE